MKNWYLSKTLWFNLITFLVLIATAFIDSGVFKNPAVAGIFGLVVTIGNMILRVFFTNQSIKSPFTPAPPPATT